jgi:hypothetical protein
MSDNEKYIGLVKWFHDKTRNANYGFIQHAKLGDLFFHESSIEKDQDINSFRENAIVVFFTQESKKQKDKIEAVGVKYLENETDINFLFEHFLSTLTEKKNYDDYNIIKKGVQSKITLLLENSTQIYKVGQLFDRFLNFLNSQIKLEKINDDEYLKVLFNVGKDFFPTHYDKIVDIVEKNISPELAHKLWLNGFINNCQINYVANIIISETSLNKEKIFNRCSENDFERLFEPFKKYVIEKVNSESMKEEEYIIEILKITKKFFPNTYNQIAEIVEKNISSELAHKLWLNSFINNCQINYVANVIISETSLNKEKIFSRCSENDFEQLFEPFKKHVIEKVNSGTKKDEEYIIEILKITKKFFPNTYNQIAEIVEKNISPELAHKLWLDNYIDKCQINHVSNIILSEPHHIKQKIFSRCSEDDKSNIFFKIIYSFEKIDTPHKLEIIKNLLKLSKEYAQELQDKILNSIIVICSEYNKLNLWLEDYYDKLDFNSYKLFTITLSPADQKKFIKKVLKYIHEEKANITVDELTSINVIDFETSKHAEKIDNSHLDYSTSIILNVISELKNKTNIETKKNSASAQLRIYDLIIKQIKQPKDILQITGFFDECQGRCSVSVYEEKNESGEVIDRKVTYDRNEHNKAKNHPICDGRKALDKATKIPLLSDEKVEYWWCANQKCFKTSRELHSPNEWEKYSLLDFLTILKVEFKESDLETYLNIINKANRFLKHLNCRECNHILYPKGKTSYAFYGVSNFYCKTETCSQIGKEIYLSHCLNSYCEMVIDSRDCCKCKPVEHDQGSCGWYICNNCHSCCSSEQLQKRKWVYDNIIHSEYKCHLEGHRNLGVISCNKCGDAMDWNESNEEQFQNILNWFIANKDKSNRIHKYGKNKKGKWWFTIKRGNDSVDEFRKKLTKYNQLGFRIPDFEKEKDLQLISEPIEYKKQNKDILTCKTCGNVLDLSNDPEKAIAVKKFHNLKFVKDIIE